VDVSSPRRSTSAVTVTESRGDDSGSEGRVVMPKVRDVLSHVCVVTTKDRRRCARNEEHRIPPGGQCLIIKAGHSNPTLSYCLKCGQEILLTATNRLRDIEASLDRCGTLLSHDNERNSHGAEFQPLGASLSSAKAPRTAGISAFGEMRKQS